MPKRKIEDVLAELKNIDVAAMQKNLENAGANFEPKYAVILSKKDEVSEYGVEETLDAVDLFLALVYAYVVGGISGYLAALVLLPGAILGGGQIPLEAEDMDETELGLIIARVIEKFPTLPTEVIQALINHALKAIYHIYNGIKIVVEGIEDPNAPKPGTDNRGKALE